MLLIDAKMLAATMVPDQFRGVGAAFTSCVFAQLFGEFIRRYKVDDPILAEQFWLADKPVDDTAALTKSGRPTDYGARSKDVLELLDTEIGNEPIKRGVESRTRFTNRDLPVDWGSRRFRFEFNLIARFCFKEPQRILCDTLKFAGFQPGSTLMSLGPLVRPLRYLPQSRQQLATIALDDVWSTLNRANAQDLDQTGEDRAISVPWFIRFDRPFDHGL